MGVLVMHGLEGRQRTSREPQHSTGNALLKNDSMKGKRIGARKRLGGKKRAQRDSACVLEAHCCRLGDGRGFACY